MASPTDIRKGRVMDYQGSPHLVLDMIHRTQGRGSGWVQASLRNLKTGSSTTVKFRSSEKVEFLHTEVNKLEFSYDDPTGYYFMDLETYDTIEIPVEMAEPIKEFLVAGNMYDLLYVDGKPIDVNLPSSVEMEITEAPEGLRGDTASAATKAATTESGLVIQVPLFVKLGDRVKINTADKSYAGRV
ncbi:MAG: elongation factor P [Verrucomicrobia bacterium]|nr:elongation factor P [Verrucomicrobiota bacterium]